MQAVLPWMLAVCVPVFDCSEFSAWSLRPPPADIAPVVALVLEPLTPELSVPLFAWLLSTTP
jgi:hypothetical protein